METKSRKSSKKGAAIAFGVLVFIIVGSSVSSSLFQSNFGQISVKQISFLDPNGNIVAAKLYRPVGATAASPAPGILALHGFNNNKDVMRPYAIELAKAGFVVLAIDQAGNGESGANYTNDTIGSYFYGFSYLTSLAFVNPLDCGVVGHSLGAIRAYILGMSIPTIRAVVTLTFPPANGGYTNDANPAIHNLLHISDAWEDFALNSSTTQQQYKTDGQNMIRTITGNSSATWDTTYGNFTNGSARRWVYVPNIDHPGLTIDSFSISQTVAWFLQSLDGDSAATANSIAAPSHQTYLWAESLGLLSVFAAFLSILPLSVLLLRTKTFEVLKQPKSKRVPWSKGYWWLWATIATAIGGVTYVYLTSFYTNLFGGQPFGADPNAPSNFLITPFTGIAVATGFMGWFLTNAGIAALFVTLWYFLVKRKNKDALSPLDLGSALRMKYPAPSGSKEADAREKITLPSSRKFWGSYMIRAIGLAFILFAWLYFLELLASWALNVNLGGVWSVLGPLTTVRAKEFWIYYWPILIFFLTTGGIFLFGEMRMKEYKSGAKTQFVWFIKYSYLLLAGLIVVFLIQYMPMWLGYGPILNGTYDASQIAPLMPIQLYIFIPLSAMMIFMLVFFYRHTGRIYLGAFTVAAIICWIQMYSLVLYF